METPESGTDFYPSYPEYYYSFYANSTPVTIHQYRFNLNDYNIIYLTALNSSVENADIFVYLTEFKKIKEKVVLESVNI
jgi:hypothetical protein